MIGRVFSTLALASLTLLAATQTPPKMGHSAHGAAFDSGMRTRPWKMVGLGPVLFDLTTSKPEVREWFNQGMALMHNFWFEEAERSFRWCHKLDPQNPMALWGMAYSGFNWFTSYNPGPGEFDRYRDFLKQAVQNKHRASPREQLYIETWDRAFAKGVSEPHRVIAEGLEAIVLRYPDDLEAKALLSFYNIGRGSPFANQLIVNEVLRTSPNHPGAHHASIHNWDDGNPEQALRSCEGYAKAAPGSGHALHMPGHIYTKVGKWHEAAWAMDAATRFELRYMNERLALPFETWNFAHNRNYLSYIQEQLGMERAALQGARDLLAAPKDPDHNPENRDYYWEGITALLRCRMKYERWEQLLTPGDVPWIGTEMGKEMRSAIEATAHAALGNIPAAREQLKAFRDRAQKRAGKGEVTDDAKLTIHEIEARILLAEKDYDGAVKALREAAKIEDRGRYGGDPPGTPYTIWRVLGDVYRQHGDPKLAISAYENALKKEPMDGFVLANLAACWKEVGDIGRAKTYATQFLSVWTSPDPGLPWTATVAGLGLDLAPPKIARPYVPAKLDSMGPSNWQPFAAPNLEVTGPDGKRVTLADFRGRNVVLVFYLSDQCAHCMEQLKAISAKQAEFGQSNAVVLAVCNATNDTAPMDGIRFLRDKGHVNARRFASYDDFEEMELHSTILIDAEGRIRWKRTGGEPFTKIDFLLNELKKLAPPR